MKRRKLKNRRRRNLLKIDIHRKQERGRHNWMYPPIDPKRMAKILGALWPKHELAEMLFPTSNVWEMMTERPK